MRKNPAAGAWTLVLSAAALAAAVLLLVADSRIEQPQPPQPHETEHGAAMEDVSDEIRIELLETQPKTLTLETGAPQILIYHTHTTEAYTMEQPEQYSETSAWRTNNQSFNVVCVGAKLASELRDTYKLNVLHDKRDHEPPYLGTSYERSLATMQEYQDKYPSIKLFIDIHRDAYTLPEGRENTDYATVDGKRCARMMFVVGTGEGKTGAGFSIKPNYRENYALALGITNALQAIDEKLARPVRVKTGRYNQHIGQNALLIEMGHNANTLTEALNSVPYMAQSIAAALRLKPAAKLALVPYPSDTPITENQSDAAPNASAEPLQLAPVSVK